MFYYLSLIYISNFSFLNVFKYLTFRSGGALLTSLIFSFLLAPVVINWLKKNQKNKKTVREDLPRSHLVKKIGTPTMGGIIILVSFIFSTLLWTDLNNTYVWIVLAITFGFGTLGFVDDYYKLTSKVDFVDLSEQHVAAIISLEKFKEIEKSDISLGKRINYRDDPVYIDPRNINLGAKIISKLKNLDLTIKKLNLIIGIYFSFL